VPDGTRGPWRAFENLLLRLRFRSIRWPDLNGVEFSKNARSKRFSAPSKRPALISFRRTVAASVSAFANPSPLLPSPPVQRSPRRLKDSPAQEDAPAVPVGGRMPISFLHLHGPQPAISPCTAHLSAKKMIKWRWADGLRHKGVISIHGDDRLFNAIATARPTNSNDLANAA
jgi:hypothetical protein